MIIFNGKSIKNAIVDSKDVKSIYKGSILVWSKTKEIVIPIDTDVFGTQYNYTNRTTSIIEDGKYIVNGYQQNTAIDTSFSISTKII